MNGFAFTLLLPYVHNKTEKKRIVSKMGMVLLFVYLHSLCYVKGHYVNISWSLVTLVILLLL